LILGSLTAEIFKINSIPFSTDVINLINCLKKIGLDIEISEGNLTIKNSFPHCEKDLDQPLEPGDGGTTTRFLIGLLARGKKTYRVKLSPEMSVRPMDELVKNLKELGVSINKTQDILEITGPYKLKHRITVEGNKSTQFASSLALALADEKIEINIKNLRNSKTYFSLTNSLIDDFKTGQREFKVPLDFSSLSYPFALGLIDGEVEIDNFTKDPFQADAKLLDFFKDSIKIDKNILKICPQKEVKPLEIDCSDCLDIVPTLSFICSYATGKSVLKNLEGLLFKETNRLKEITNLLDLFGVSYNLKNDYSLEIIGSTWKSDFKEYQSPKDHRMAMTAFLFMKRNNGGVIYNSSCVEKSFPGFFTLMN
jgi:3-phosphoshikimate 1-carboxyvinyltransferase